MITREDKLEHNKADLEERHSKLEKLLDKTLFMVSEGEEVSRTPKDIKAEISSIDEEMSDIDRRLPHARNADRRDKVEVEHQEKVQALAGLQVEREKLEASAKHMVRAETNFKKGYGEYQESCGEVLRLLKIIRPDTRNTGLEDLPGKYIKDRVKVILNPKHWRRSENLDEEVTGILCRDIYNISVRLGVEMEIPQVVLADERKAEERKLKALEQQKQKLIEPYYDHWKKHNEPHQYEKWADGSIREEWFPAGRIDRYKKGEKFNPGTDEHFTYPAELKHKLAELTV